MISVTPLWNRNRSSKPAPRALRNTSLKEICNISSALTAKSESLSHTSQSVPATHCPARVTFSRTWPPKKTLCKRLCVLVLHCFHPDDMKKVNHHHADRTLSRSFVVIVMEHLYLTTVNKFGSSSSEHELMKYVAHARETIRLQPYSGRQPGCTSIGAYFLCPHGPLPLSQSRHEHVHRARRTRKGLVCIYVGGVCRHVGGVQPHEPTQVHERMTRKCDIWPHLTPLHTAHTHHITTRQSH